MIGLDTGFFIHLRSGNPHAVSVWKRVEEGESACISSITAYELLRMGYSESTGKMSFLVERLVKAIRVASVGEEAARMAARIVHGTKMPSLSAIILASLIQSGAKEIYTSDGYMALYAGKDVNVVNLGPIDFEASSL